MLEATYFDHDRTGARTQGEAPISGAYSHAYMVIIVRGGEFDIATAPGLSPPLEPLAETGGVAVRPRRGRRSLAGSTPRGDFSDATGGARTIVGLCFEVFESGEHDD
jgi:hypothetical protein